jgi:hypothetical protein
LVVLCFVSFGYRIRGGSGFECGFEPGNNLLAWDILSVFIAFIFFELEIILVYLVLIGRLLVRVALISGIMLYELMTIGFGI